MIRRMAQTVRWPMARRAPTARVWALVQTQWENSGAKAARMATISGGRSTGVVSRTDGSRITVDHGQRPLDLLASLGWRRAGQLSDLAKAEFDRQAEIPSAGQRSDSPCRAPEVSSASLK